MRIDDRLSALLPRDELRGHPALQRPGTIQGEEGDDILELRGGQPLNQVLDPRTLELKDPGRPPLPQEPVDLGVVEGDLLKRDCFFLALLEEFQCIVDHGEVPEAQEVDLEHSDGLQIDHVILGDHRPIAQAQQRGVVGQLPGGDHHPRGMGRRVPG